MQSHGIAADKIAEITKTPIPQSLYYEIAMKAEKTAKKAETVLYNTTHLPETDNMYYKDHGLMEFGATILDVFKNV
jgi:hypothetical protein